MNYWLFGGLPILILMGDFYQFSPVVGRLLWDEEHTDEDCYGKMLWRGFDAIITLRQQNCASLMILNLTPYYNVPALEP